MAHMPQSLVESVLVQGALVLGLQREAKTSSDVAAVGPYRAESVRPLGD
jgi:hypothetical protein